MERCRPDSKWKIPMEKLSGLLAAYKAGKHPSGLAREYGVMQKTVEAALVRAAREHLGLPICPPKIHERAKNHNVWVEWLDEHGYGVEEIYRKPSSNIDLALHGISLPRLVKLP